MPLSMPQIRRPARGRLVTGLDIEPGAVRAVQARVEGSRLVVERAASAVLEPGIVRDGEVVEPQALGEVLKELFAEHKLDKRVRIGVANQRVVVRHLLLPPITDAKQVETAVRFMAADELPMPIDQAVIDHVVLGPVDTAEGPRTRVLVVAARRSMIDSLLAAAQAAGLRTEGIDLAAFAMVRAAGARGDEATLHVAVGGVVNLAVTRAGECVFTRVVAGGLEAMAGELAEREMISVEEARDALGRVRLDAEPPAAPEPVAEVIPEPEPVAEVAPEPELEPAEDEPVLFFASPPPKPTVVAESEVVSVAEVAPEPEPEPEPVPAASAEDRLLAEARAVVTDGLRRIAGEVRNSIDFHLTSGGDQDATVQRVLLTGPALAVPGFAEELSRRLSLPVEAADVEGTTEPGAFAVAAGLAVEELAA